MILPLTTPHQQAQLAHQNDTAPTLSVGHEAGLSPDNGAHATTFHHIRYRDRKRAGTRGVYITCLRHHTHVDHPGRALEQIACHCSAAAEREEGSDFPSWKNLMPLASSDPSYAKEPLTPPAVRPEHKQFECRWPLQHCECHRANLPQNASHRTEDVGMLPICHQLVNQTRAAINILLHGSRLTNFKQLPNKYIVHTNPYQSGTRPTDRTYPIAWIGHAAQHTATNGQPPKIVATLIQRCGLTE